MMNRKNANTRVPGRQKLNRRILLRGLGGIAVALPALECMLDSRGTRLANAEAGMPLRYGVVFAGQALGGDGFAKNAQRIQGSPRMEGGHFIAPTDEGRSYALTTPLEPLASLRNEFSVLSELSIPFNKNSTEGDAVPPGGAYRDFHGGGCSPLLSGTRSTNASFRANGISSDQAVAEQLGGETQRQSLVYRVQPSWYLSGSSYAGRQYLSYGPGGKRIEGQASPQVAFQSLFDGFSPDGGAAQAVHDYRRRARLSVLDLLTEKEPTVLKGVSAADRRRLEQHFEQLRTLEKRLDMIDSFAGSCQLPAGPGADPVIGANNAGSGGADIQQNTGYSDEAGRARVFADLLHMAFVCDLTRSFTLQLSTFQSHMNVLALTTELGLPIRADLHEVGHNGDPDNKGQLAVSTCLKWHIGHYAYLLQLLKDTPEGAGTVLDNSALVFMPEAGHGTQLNDAVSENQTHSVEQMVLLLAGRAGGLAPGQHIRATGKHPVQGLLSGMLAVGYAGDALGEVNGHIPELFA